MRFFLSKRLPFGLRAGVLTDPVRFGSGQARPIRTGSPIRELGANVVCVYVITGPHGMSKIGYSTDPEMRLAALQTAAHVPLKLHYVLAVQNIDPRQIEAEAHRRLDAHRCSGEWFDVTPEIAEDAVNQAAAHFGIQTVQTTSDHLANAMASPPAGVSRPAPTLAGEVFGGLVRPFLVILALSVAFVVALNVFHLI